MGDNDRVRILCVDDEANVLTGLALHLRRSFHVVTATGGAAGLQLLAEDPYIAVVISDMRMPGMDGAEFLAKSRRVAPNAVRMLLTGQTDLSSAVAAVNEGGIFRFLTKPCPPAQLLAAVDSAAAQHRLITAERVLLEQTLHGAVRALTEALALTNPISFGRATRIKHYATQLANKLEMSERWQLEVAAMLSQLAFITLPPETAERVYYGEALSELEQKMVRELPAVTERLLGNIPRLEPVREILAGALRSWRKAQPGDDPAKRLIEQASQVLSVATDFDALETRGDSATRAIDTMRGRNRYDPDVLTALAGIRGSTSAQQELREIPLAALRVGMRFAEDVKTSGGVLLVPRGHEVTESFIERVRNFRAGAIKEPVRVVLKTAVPANAA